MKVSVSAEVISEEHFEDKKNLVNWFHHKLLTLKWS